MASAFSEYNLSNIITTDKAAVFMGQGFKTAIKQKGASSICVASTSYEKAVVTCILAIHHDETKSNC